MTLIDDAVTHNQQFLGLDKLPVNTQRRIAALIADYQGEVGLDANGKYDRRTEAVLNDLVIHLGGTSAPVPPPPTPSVPDGKPGFTNSEVVARGMRMVAECAAPGTKNHYVYGGGSPYTKASAFDNDEHGCDCTGALWWFWGALRGAFNTDAIIDDVWERRNGVFTGRVGPRKRCLPVDPARMQPGDALVFAGKDENGDGAREAAGHAMLIKSVKPGCVLHVGDWVNEVELIHCRWKERAVRVTNGHYADYERTRCVRFKQVRYP